MALNFSERLAARVQAELTARGAKQSELATYLGVTQSMISRRLAGKYAFPLHELPLIAGFFDITIEELLGGRAAVNSGQHPVSPPPNPDGRRGKQRAAGPTRGLQEQTSDDEQVAS